MKRPQRITGCRFPAACLLFVLMAIVTIPAFAQNPYGKPDESWISISGTVEEVRSDAFTLNYGKGTILVEMDDGDRDADGYKLVAGDQVTVNGKIDDDFFERTTIEASSVFVVKLGTIFFASSADEEDYLTHNADPVVLTGITVQGTVTAVGREEFMINTGERRVTVEVDEMAFNPLDDEGYQKVEPGDFVRVNGYIDDDFLEGRELVAGSVIELRD
ncbi:MAG: DUF5666 domain-containing protein [Syntrophotaleaceae bacterium]